MFLKHRGFAYFPIIRGGNLCDPSAFAHKAMDRRSLFFLRPERRLVANVRSGSSLQSALVKMIINDNINCNLIRNILIEKSCFIHIVNSLRRIIGALFT